MAQMTDGENDDKASVGMALAVLTSMYAEVNPPRNMPPEKRCELINTMIHRLERGLQACREKEVEKTVRSGSTTWIPSRTDLKQIHNRNDESVRRRLRRGFKVREALLAGLKFNNVGASLLPGGKRWVLDCLADRGVSYLGRRLIQAYREQSILPVQARESGASSVFATYIYSALKRPVVAEEYRQIFASGKVNIRHAKSGTLIFVPHSELVTMSTHGMVCKEIEIENSQIFSYDEANRFVLLPHLLQILGLREDNALLSTLVREMDDNAYLVSDPITFDVRACMMRTFETTRREFRVSTLHEAARQAVGPDYYPEVVREVVSLLTRLGASVPPEYVARSSFYDVTRQMKGYRDQSTQIRILFDRGVTLDGLGGDVIIHDTPDSLMVGLYTATSKGFVIAKITGKNLRRKPPDDDDEEIRQLTAAAEASGLVKVMRPVFDICGELRLAVTQSDPGRGLLSHFKNCEAQ